MQNNFKEIHFTTNILIFHHQISLRIFSSYGDLIRIQILIHKSEIDQFHLELFYNKQTPPTSFRKLIATVMIIIVALNLTCRRICLSMESTILA